MASQTIRATSHAHLITATKRHILYHYAYVIVRIKMPFCLSLWAILFACLAENYLRLYNVQGKALLSRKAIFWDIAGLFIELHNQLQELQSF